MKVSRFRWVTVQRALDLLVADQRFTNAKAISFIEEIGCGPDYDRLPQTERSTPKLRNLLSKACREEPIRMDTEGTILSDRVVREAATYIPKLEMPRYWHMKVKPEFSLYVVGFLNTLAVDGWGVVDRQLVPHSPIPIDERRSRLQQALQDAAAIEALQRLDQLEKGLDEGHWESANGDTRGFLNAVFNTIADMLPQTKGLGLKEGAARVKLQEIGFFKPNNMDPKKSYEANIVKELSSLLGSEGAHTGSSDSNSSVFRYHLAVITADHFITRAKTN